MHSVKPAKRVAKQQKATKVVKAQPKRAAVRTAAKRTIQTAKSSPKVAKFTATASFSTPSRPAFITPSFTAPQPKFSLPPVQFTPISNFHTITTIPAALHGVKMPTNSGVFQTQKRGFLDKLGGAASALGSAFGMGKKESAAGSGGMNMMQMMEMMNVMQKFTKAMQDGKFGEKEYQELTEQLDKMKAMNGGQLPPDLEPLFEKIKNRQPITPNEIMSLTGMDPNDLNELREATLKMKSGQMNQMQFFMQIAQVMQRVDERKKTQPKIEGDKNSV